MQSVSTRECIYNTYIGSDEKIPQHVLDLETFKREEVILSEDAEKIFLEIIPSARDNVTRDSRVVTIIINIDL